MFGDISNMIKKVKEIQDKVEEAKSKLDTILINEVVANEHIKVTVTANCTVKAISIDESLLKDKEKLEEHLMLALNKALTKAKEINEQAPVLTTKVGISTISEMDKRK